MDWKHNYLISKTNLIATWLKGFLVSIMIYNKKCNQVGLDYGFFFNFLFFTNEIKRNLSVHKYRRQTIISEFVARKTQDANSVLVVRAGGVARRWSSPLQRGLRCSSPPHRLTLVMPRRSPPPRLHDEAWPCTCCQIFLFFFSIYN